MVPPRVYNGVALLTHSPPPLEGPTQLAEQCFRKWVRVPLCLPFTDVGLWATYLSSASVSLSVK